MAVLIAEAFVNYALGQHLLTGDCHSPQHRICLHDKSHSDAQRGVFRYCPHVSEQARGKNGVDVLLQLAAVGRASRLRADDSVNLAWSSAVAPVTVTSATSTWGSAGPAGAGVTLGCGAGLGGSGGTVLAGGLVGAGLAGAGLVGAGLGGTWAF